MKYKAKNMLVERTVTQFVTVTIDIPESIDLENLSDEDSDMVLNLVSNATEYRKWNDDEVSYFDYTIDK
jgi:hypothetical protein